MARGRIYFLVPSLEYLIKGGRIGGASGLIGTVLQIKPILTFTTGHVEPFERVRTHKQALNRLREIVLEQIPRDGQGYLTVMHAGVPEAGQALADELGAALGLTTVPLHEVPPAVIVHGGPGILGAGFFVGE
jgi:DegV family protein with EDD domain